jgi:hypothetical protein
MIRITQLNTNTYGISLSLRSIHCIIMSFLKLIDIEMLSAVRLASQRENPY